MPDDAALLAALPDAILLVENGEVIWANAAAETLAGGPVVGQPLDALWAPADLVRVRRWIDRPHARVQPLVVRFQGRSPPVPAELMLGRCHGPTLITARDVSGVAKALEHLGVLGQRLSEAHRLADPSVLLDAAVPELLAMGWRGALLRYRPEGVEVVRVFHDPRHPDPVGTYVAGLKARGLLPLDEVPVSRTTWTLQEPFHVWDAHRYPRVNGSTEFARHMRAAGLNRGVWIPVGAEARADHMLVVVGADLTETDFAALYLLAAQIGASLRLERLRTGLVRQERLAAVGEMAGVLAHEVRNPLGVVFNVVAGLRRRLGDDGPAHRLLDAVDAEAEQLNRLVGGLVSLARLPAPQARPMDLAALVTELVAALPAGVRARVRFDSTPAPRVQGDPELLRQAIGALVDNAVQHGRPGAPVRLGLWPEEAAVALAVDSEGSPIPEGVAAQMCQPMFSTRADAAGFGLAVCRRVLDDLGGTVAYEPRTTGARFVVRVPTAEGEG